MSPQHLNLDTPALWQEMHRYVTSVLSLLLLIRLPAPLGHLKYQRVTNFL